MKSPFLRIALLAAPLIFGSCKTTAPDGFKLEVEGPTQEPSFQSVSMNKGLDPKWLKPPTEPYRLGPGDLIEIEVAEVSGTLSRTFVMPDGMVYYNLAGGVKAEGLTVSELSKSLKEALMRDYTDPLVNVSIVEVKSRRYWILGRVFKPGIFPLRQPTTLLEAISQSGGLFTSQFSGTTEELADLDSSVVIRDGRILPVDFKSLVYQGNTSQNLYLQHNDFVYIPSSQSGSILLLGTVKEPKSVAFRNSLSVVECLAYGKGPAPGAYLRKVVVVRGSMNKPKVATVDVQAILTGKAPNVSLRPGDIVWVPRSPFSSLSEGVELVFRDAARTIAINEGAALGGSNQKSQLTLPAVSAP